MKRSPFHPVDGGITSNHRAHSVFSLGQNHLCLGEMLDFSFKEIACLSMGRALLFSLCKAFFFSIRGMFHRKGSGKVDELELSVSL